MRGLVLRGGLLALVAAIGVAAATLAPAARTSTGVAASATYVDEVGESGAAPDVHQVTVTEDTSGVLTLAFVVDAFNAPAGTSGGAEVFVCLDSDQNGSTGSRGGGCDYAVAVERGATTQLLRFYTWNGTALASQIDPPGLTYSGSGGTFSLSFSNAMMGNSSAFDFYVYTSAFTGPTVLGTEYAPGHGWWRFPPPVAAPVTTTAPTATVPAPQPTVVGVPVTSGPPVAGQRFQAIYSVSGADSAAARVTVDGRAVSAAAAFRDGNEHVSLVVPKTAAGRTLRISVTAGSFVRTTALKVHRK